MTLLLSLFLIISPVFTLPQGPTNTVEYQPFYDLIYGGTYPPNQNTKLTGYDKNTFIKTLQNGRSSNEIIKDDSKTTNNELINSANNQENVIPKSPVQNIQPPPATVKQPVVQTNAPVNNIPNETYNRGHVYQYRPYTINSKTPPTAVSSPAPFGGVFSTFIPPQFSIMNFQMRTNDIFDILDLARAAMYDFFDVPMIRSLVDLYFDGFTPRGRTDIGDIPRENENEGIRRFLTTAAGGLLGKEKCWERLNCKMGELLTDIQGKNIMFKLIEKVVPPQWSRFRSSLELVEEGSNDNHYCIEFECQDSRLLVEAENREN